MLKCVAGALAVAMSCQASSAQLTIIEQFDTNVGTLVGLAFGQSRGRVWLYAGFAASLLRHTRSGAADGTAPALGTRT